MIALGLSAEEKRRAVTDYCAEHRIQRVVALSPSKYRVVFDHDQVRHTEWAEIIQYKHFYPILQETDRHTLVVVNECLRTSDRNCLTYNCIRHFLNQTPHAIVFQRFPILETFDDVMILVDFATNSRWKRDRFDRRFLDGVDVRGTVQPLTLERVHVPTSDQDHAAYAKARAELFANIGARDPHTIPRTLHLLSGKAKLRVVNPGARYVGRNNRFSLENLVTFDEESFGGTETVFEFCHGMLAFSDFVALSGQTKVTALVSELKVDRWYAERAETWMKEVARAYAALL
jgi:hypothetical protein